MSGGEYPKDLKYTKDHEWAKKTGSSVVIGVTWHAQDAIGAVAYVELPKIGATVTEGKPFGVIESTKAVSELFAPLSGKVVKINDALVTKPETINDSPYANAWIIEIEPSNAGDFDKLLSADDYVKLLG